MKLSKTFWWGIALLLIGVLGLSSAKGHYSPKKAFYKQNFKKYEKDYRDYCPVPGGRGDGRFGPKMMPRDSWHYPLKDATGTMPYFDEETVETTEQG